MRKDRLAIFFISQDFTHSNIETYDKSSYAMI